MSGTILVAFGTRHGSTYEVARAVAETMQECGREVETLPAGLVDDVTPYAAIVLGGALYTGRWHRDASQFLHRHRQALAARPVAVFGMGPRTMDEQEVESSRAQVAKALAKTPEIEPVAVAVFGGVVNPAALHFPFNRMPASDARDWDAIRAWAVDLAGSAAFGKAASEAVDLRRQLQQTP